MKTKDIPAIVMLMAGGLYCLLGIYYQFPLMDFMVQLLIVLLVFWIIGGILRMVLNRFMGEIKVKTDDEADSKEEKNTETETDEVVEEEEQA